MSTLQLKGLITGTGSKDNVPSSGIAKVNNGSISDLLDYRGAWALMRGSGSGHGHISVEAKSSSKPTVSYSAQINDQQLYAKGQAIDGVILVTPGMFGTNPETEGWKTAVEAALPTMPTKETIFSFTDGASQVVTVLLVPVPATSVTENQGGATYIDCTEASLSFSGKAEQLNIGAGKNYNDTSLLNATEYIAGGQLVVNGSGMAKVSSN